MYGGMAERKVFSNTLRYVDEVYQRVDYHVSLLPSPWYHPPVCEEGVRLGPASAAHHYENTKGGIVLQLSASRHACIDMCMAMTSLATSM